MAKVSTDIRRIAPELIEAIKIIDILARKRNYAQVYSDLIDWAIAMHHFPPMNFALDKRYDKVEIHLIPEIWKIISIEYRKRVCLWTGDYSLNGWFDGLGKLYEVLTSRGKSSMLGQFFTPPSLVNVIVMLNDPAKPGQFAQIFDPPCGSGRLGIAGAVYAMGKKSIPIPLLNDLDPICAKMTALNMCLHGIAGEVTCMNMFDLRGETYRFGYRVRPVLSYFPQEMWEFYTMVIGLQTKQSVRKSYVIEPFTYEQTMLKRMNDKVIKDMTAEAAKREREEKEQKMNDLKEEISKRMEGTLFDGDQTQIENIANQIKEEISQNKKASKEKKSKDEDDQLSLF